jgi:hypothetical protein
MESSSDPDAGLATVNSEAGRDLHRGRGQEAFVPRSDVATLPFYLARERLLGRRAATHESSSDAFTLRD